ncbi:MAG: hypothetical protein HY820_13440 [Acidobacteria bacterium]|nr:hypothetical protein [Acidobacteriota bacterium]
MFLFAAASLCAAQSKKAKPPADLATIRANPQPDARYWAALEFANSLIDVLRKQYQEGKIEEMQKSLSDLQEAVQLCDDTLRATGKNPSKSPKHFKKAELKEREILRRLRTLEDEVSVEERSIVTKVRTKVAELHDELLYDIMGRRK